MEKSTKRVTCSNCNIVISELLAFIQNKMDVMDEQSLLKICESAFSDEDIESAKLLLFECLQNKRPKTSKYQGKTQRTIDEILTLMKETDPVQLPNFVAKRLEKLPPVTFDNIDVTSLLKKLAKLEKSVQEVQQKYDTKTELREQLEEIRKNIERGTYSSLDTGPMALSNSCNNESSVLEGHERINVVERTSLKPKAVNILEQSMSPVQESGASAIITSATETVLPYDNTKVRSASEKNNKIMDCTSYNNTPAAMREVNTDTNESAVCGTHTIVNNVNNTTISGVTTSSSEMKRKYSVNYKENGERERGEQNGCGSEGRRGKGPRTRGGVRAGPSFPNRSAPATASNNPLIIYEAANLYQTKQLEVPLSKKRKVDTRDIPDKIEPNVVTDTMAAWSTWDYIVDSYEDEAHESTGQTQAGSDPNTDIGKIVDIECCEITPVEMEAVIPLDTPAPSSSMSMRTPKDEPRTPSKCYTPSSSIYLPSTFRNPSRRVKVRRNLSMKNAESSRASTQRSTSGTPLTPKNEPLLTSKCSTLSSSISKQLRTFRKPMRRVKVRKSLNSVVSSIKTREQKRKLEPAKTSAAEGAPALVQPSPPSSNSPRCLTPTDEECIENINYGSEDEYDFTEADLDDVNIAIPRAFRIYYENVQETVVGDAFLDPCFPPKSVPQSERVTSPVPAVPSTVLTDPTTGMTDTDKFMFQWRACPQPPIDPRLRRENFIQTDCGPTTHFADPYSAFTAIWDRRFMHKIAMETNRYAQQFAATALATGTLKPSSRITQWRDTTAEEMYVFFAVVIAMGTIVKSHRDEYWSTSRDIFSTPGFSRVMSSDRFILLNTCLHFCDNTTCDRQSLTQAQAKLFKLTPIVDHLNRKFQELYVLSQNIALDESLTQWKGWLSINQFIPNKAAAVGIKTYEICESNTGYLWRFEVHAGSSDDHANPSENNLLSAYVPALVLRLLNGLENLGHTVWMDNYYNSPVLARELKSRGFDCVGTLRLNRKFVPAELASMNKHNMALGQMCGSTSGDVDIVLWRDNNLVSVISTYHGLQTVACGSKIKPNIIADYNLCMGGVDRKDQMLAMFPIERKRTRIWYKKVFKRLLNVSVLNAYILLKSSEKKMCHRKFRSVLVNQLIDRHNTPQTIPRMYPTCYGHVPAQYDMIGQGERQDRPRRLCVICKKRVATYCAGCDKAMCLFTCFGPYHRQNKISGK